MSDVRSKTPTHIIDGVTVHGHREGYFDGFDPKEMTVVFRGECDGTLHLVDHKSSGLFHFRRDGEQPAIVVTHGSTGIRTRAASSRRPRPT